MPSKAKYYNNCYYKSNWKFIHEDICIMKEYFPFISYANTQSSFPL